MSHQICESEEQAFEEIRYLMSFLPQSSSQKPPAFITEDESSRTIESLDSFIPENRNQPYDMAKIISDISDDGEHYPIQSNYALNIITTFARVNGNTIGIVANQPMELAGVLDIKASEKAARFVRFCDAFNIPILTLVDVPGFLPGVEQEHGGIIRSGAKLLYAYSEATVPRVCVVIRKAYGGAYIVMDSIGLGADKLFAWPSGEIAVMGAEGAVDIIHRRELAAADNKEELKSKLVAEYNDKFSNPDIAAQLGLIDNIIKPSETRKVVIDSFKDLVNKGELGDKHGNIPSKNIAITWVEKGSIARNLFLALGFAILTALSAQIRVVIPISPVPITGQTFVVLLSGLILGSTFGAISMLMYLFIGMSGLPFFSAGVAGLAILKSPTIGYIIGFFLAAYIVGAFAAKPVLAILLGSLTIYIAGVSGLMIILNTSFSNALAIGVVPF